METCKDYSEKQILDYVCNRMTVEEETKFQYHLLACPYCNRRLYHLRRFAPSAARSRMTFLGFRPLLALAAAIVVIVAGGLGYYLSRESAYVQPSIDSSPLYYQSDSIKTDLYPDSCDELNDTMIK